MSIREKIDSLKRVKESLQSNQIQITDSLLKILENIGVNLSGYGELSPVKEEKGNEKILTFQTKEDQIGKAA